MHQHEDARHASRQVVYALAEHVWQHWTACRVTTEVETYDVRHRVVAHLAKLPTPAEAEILVRELPGLHAAQVEHVAHGTSTWLNVHGTWRGEAVILTVFHRGGEA
jgi:hypothetical protein